MASVFLLTLARKLRSQEGYGCHGRSQHIDVMLRKVATANEVSRTSLGLVNGLHS